jgi:L-fuculose-phosphate aldolase
MYMDRGQATAEIKEAGRRMYEHRLIVALQGNLSARIGENRVLATAAGICKGFLRDEDLLEVDLDGRSTGARRPSSELALHLAIYRLRPDVAAVVHGHPAYATAHASAGRGLEDCLLPEVVAGLGRVPLSRYATPGTPDVGEAVAEFIAEYDAVLLRNHGVVTCGSDVMCAFYKLETVEHLAQISLVADLAGGRQALTREQVAALEAVKGNYGLGGGPSACWAFGESPVANAPRTAADGPLPTEEAGLRREELARIVAEEVVRALGD